MHVHAIGGSIPWPCYNGVITTNQGDGAAVIHWVSPLLSWVHQRVLEYHRAAHGRPQEGLSLGVDGEVLGSI